MANPMMAASIEQFGQNVKKLKADIALVIGGGGSAADVAVDLNSLLGDLGEFILGLAGPATVGCDQSAVACCDSLRADCEALATVASKAKGCAASPVGANGEWLTKFITLAEQLMPLIIALLPK